VNESSSARRETVRPEDPWGIEWVRVARRVLRPGPGVIGLVSVGDVEVRPSAARLAQAVHALSGDPVALVDAWPRWGDALPDAPEGVQLLDLPAEPDAGAAVEALGRATGPARARFRHLIADLTGLVPDHHGAAMLADAFVLLGAAGRTREDDLLAVHRALPAGRDLGVVLIG
jgi:hypothetical protein